MDIIQSNSSTTIGEFASVVTTKGRRDYQQDAALIGDDFVVLADGMGGQPDGDLASRTAVEAVVTSLIGSDRSATSVQDAMTAADKAVGDLHAPSAEGRMPYGYRPENWPATTLIVVVKSDDGYIVGHLGDSRAWIFDPKAEELIQVTTDHEGFWGGITRYVGGTGHSPDVISLASPTEDEWFIVVASDGLFEATNDEALTDTLTINTSSGATAMANGLVRRAELDMSRDNITVAVIPC